MRSILIGLYVAMLSATPVRCDEQESHTRAERPPVVEVEGQPLGANVVRLLRALEMHGAPLSIAVTEALQDAARSRDAAR